MTNGDQSNDEREPIESSRLISEEKANRILYSDERLRGVCVRLLRLRKFISRRNVLRDGDYMLFM